MRGWAAWGALALAIGTSWFSMVGTAHHGSAFVAYGTATHDAGASFDAKFEWGGTSVSIGRMTLRDPGTEASLLPVSMAVDYAFGEVRWETRDGCDIVEAIEETYTSKVPGLLDLEGTRYTNWCAEPLETWGPYAGRFLSSFDVDVCMNARCV
jgi:hypothetical protein